MSDLRHSKRLALAADQPERKTSLECNCIDIVLTRNSRHKIITLTFYPVENKDGFDKFAMFSSSRYQKWDSPRHAPKAFAKIADEVFDMVEHRKGHVWDGVLQFLSSCGLRLQDAPEEAKT